MPFFVIECSCQYLNKNYVILEVASCVFHHIQIEKQVDYFVRAINLEEVSDLKDSIFISRQNAFPPKHIPAKTCRGLTSSFQHFRRTIKSEFFKPDLLFGLSQRFLLTDYERF